MKWYKVMFEPFDLPWGKHYLGFISGDFKLVSQGVASLFSEDSFMNDDRLKNYLKGKTYKKIAQSKIYDFMKYRC